MLFKKTKKNFLILNIFLCSLFISSFISAWIFLVIYIIFQEYLFFLYISLIISFLQIFSIIIWNIFIRKKSTKWFKDNNNLKNWMFENSLDFGEIGFIIYSNKEKVIWTNNYLSSILKLDLLNKNISFILDNLNNNRFEIENYIFSIKHYKEINLILLKDISSLSFEKKKFEQDLLAIGLINIDNYNNVINSVSESIALKLNKNVVNYLIEWALSRNLLIKKISTEQYLIISNKKKIETLFKKKEFDKLLNLLLKNSKLLKGNINISMGFSYGVSDPLFIYDNATQNLSTALTRGGDQIVIKNLSNLEYKIVDGETIGQSNKYRTKLKVFSNQLIEAIKNSKKIVISGHISADYDSLGSAFGIYLIALLFSKKAYILLDFNKVDKNIREILNQFFIFEEYSKIFVSTSRIHKLIEKDNLYVMVDTSLYERTEFPEMFKSSKKTFVIDHHRTSINFDDRVTTSYIDPYASSTSEIVCEIINFYENLITKQFIQNNNKILNGILTFLLCGIYIDTNFFRNKTTSKTFEMSAKLKEWGADSTIIKKLLQTDLKTMNNYLNILKNLNVYLGFVAITYDPNKKNIYSKSIIAMAAQEALKISEITLGFAFAFIKKNLIHVSCRSVSNSINIQKIAEHFGGGGSHDSAAFSINSSNILEVKNNLLKYLKTIKI